MVDLGIQFLQHAIRLIFLLQIHVSRDVCQVYDVALFVVEMEKIAIHYDSLGLFFVCIDAVRSNELANFSLIHRHHLIHFHFVLTLLYERVRKRALCEDLCKRMQLLHLLLSGQQRIETFSFELVSPWTLK